jgi:putative ABC transport system permease protein
VRALLVHFSLAYARRHPLRILLAALAVALGSALLVSVEVSRESAREAFRKTALRLSGGARLQVSRGRTLGVEEAALAVVDRVPGVRAVPVIQAAATVRGEPPVAVTVLGLDFAREAALKRWGGEGPPKLDPAVLAAGDGVVVTRPFAAARGLRPGGPLDLDTPSGPRRLRVLAVADGGLAELFGGEVLVLPLRAAQRLFRKEGRYDRIEVATDTDAAPGAAALRAALGPGFEVGAPAASSALLDEAMNRLEALLGAAVIALLVGIFITYNSVSISVAERVKEIGTLRALGASRGQVLGTLLTEWGLAGLAGSAAGVGIGILLAKVFLRMTAGEVNQITRVVDVVELHVTSPPVVLGLLTGTLSAIAGALVPARRAMLIAPIELLRPASWTRNAAGRSGALFAAGSLAVAAGAFLPSLAPSLRGVGLAATFLAFLGAALVLPQLTLWAARALRPVLRRRLPLAGFLAAEQLSAAPQRTALTVIAVAGALGMMVSTSAVVLSFKAAGRRWIDESFPFHASVNAVDLASTLYADRPLPPGVREAVEGADGVDSVYAVRAVVQGRGERDVMILGIEMDGYARMQERHGGSGYVRPDARAALREGRGVVVSGNFALLHGVGKGDRVELETRRGPRSFEVAAIHEDYLWPQGTVYLDLAVYRELWQDPGVSYLDVRFAPGLPPAEGRRRLQERVREFGAIFVYDVAHLKSVSDATLDRTLRFANAQVGVAGLIGFLGVVNTLLISVLGRTRELGLLRAVGMTRGQVAAMIAVESTFLSLAGGVLGVALGLLGARGPLLFHVAQISGYAVPMAIPWAAAGGVLLAALVLGVAASVLPARRALQAPLIQSVSWE